MATTPTPTSWIATCPGTPASSPSRPAALTATVANTPGGHGAERAAHAVDREHVERVVHAETQPQQRGAVADDAHAEADEDRRRPASRSRRPG